MSIILKLAKLYEDSIYSFLKNAGDYDLFKNKIEEAARKNKKPFKHWFTEGDRIYLDYSPQPVIDDNDQEVIDFLKNKNYSVDYLAGYAEKDGRKIRIGKLLQSLSDKDDDVNYLINIFNNSKARTGSQKQLKIVISQDIHDIGSMSTDRGWTSCMNLKGGANADSVYCEVASGGLIAYLIEKDDLDIKKPLARVLIRRYSNRSGKSYAVLEEQVYGSAPADFLKKIQEYLDEKQGYSRGVYKLRGGWYSDSLEEEVFPKPKSWQDEAEIFFKKNKDYPFLILNKILNNKSEFSDEIIKKAENQIFKDLVFAYGLLNGHPFKIKNYKYIFADFLNKNLDKVDELINIGTDTTLKYFAKDVKNEYPEVSLKINKYLLSNAEKKLSYFENNENKNNYGENSKYSILEALYLKLEMAPANNLLNVISEVLNYAQNNLNLENIFRLIRHITHIIFINDFINIRVINLIKPWLESLFTADPYNAYYDNKYFLNRCGSLVSFLLPELTSLLNSSSQSGNKSFEEGTYKRKELEALIKAIKTNVPIDFRELEREFFKKQKLNK